MGRNPARRMCVGGMHRQAHPGQGHGDGYGADLVGDLPEPGADHPDGAQQRGGDEADDEQRHHGAPPPAGRHRTGRAAPAAPSATVSCPEGARRSPRRMRQASASQIGTIIKVRASFTTTPVGRAWW